MKIAYRVINKYSWYGKPSLSVYNAFDLLSQDYTSKASPPPKKNKKQKKKEEEEEEGEEEEEEAH